MVTVQTGAVLDVSPSDPDTGGIVTMRPAGGLTLPMTSHRTSVVLVDDSGEVRAIYRFVLDRADDFEVVGEATDGIEGLTAARTLQPDLVLLDIAMPVMDGLQALPLILDACPATTVVMLTGYGVSSGLPQKTAVLGAAGYILKGTPMGAVLSELRAILAERVEVPEPRPGSSASATSEPPCRSSQSMLRRARHQAAGPGGPFQADRFRGGSCSSSPMPARRSR